MILYLRVNFSFSFYIEYENKIINIKQWEKFCFTKMFIFLGIYIIVNRDLIKLQFEIKVLHDITRWIFNLLYCIRTFLISMKVLNIDQGWEQFFWNVSNKLVYNVVIEFHEDDRKLLCRIFSIKVRYSINARCIKYKLHR